MARTANIKEWKGRTDDSAVPDGVQLRIADRQRPTALELPLCHCCDQPIRDGDGMDLDHVVPLIDGGAHAESNLRAVHRKCHRMKTAREAHARAEYRAKQKSALGIRKRSSFQSQGFRPAPPQNSATREIVHKSEVDHDRN